MTNYKRITGDFNFMFNSRVILIKPILNGASNVDFGGIIQFNINSSSKTNIYMGCYEPWLIADGTEYYQKIGVQVGRDSLCFTFSGTYTSWTINGFDIYTID